MESAPPGSVALKGCPVWRAAVVALAVATIASAAAWAVGRPGETAILAAALGVGIGAAVGAVGLLSCPIGRLGWADDRWRFEPGPSGASADRWRSSEGTIAVALDLGNVLLLTFHPDDGSLPPGLASAVARACPRTARAVARLFPRWLPVERGSTEGDWHGLRVALALGRGR